MNTETKPNQPSAAELADENLYELPWTDDARRQLYERIVPLAWPLLSGMLTPPGEDPPAAFRDWDVEPRLGPIARHLAHVGVSLEDQVAFLEVSGGVPEPWWWSYDRCECRICTEARRSGDPGTFCENWLRHAFTRRLAAVLESAFRLQLRYDRRLGLPRRLQRNPWQGRARQEVSR